MEKREGLRAGISSIRQDYRSGGLVSKEGPRLQFNTGSLVKTRQQFYSDYEQENPKPRGGGGAGGAKSRAAYATAQEEAFSNYLGDIATGIGFTPTQSRDAFKAEYEKTNPAPTGTRVYYKVRDAWNAGFNTAFDNYQQSYINDLSAALAAKNKKIAAANEEAKAGSGSQNTTSSSAAVTTTGETAMVSNAEIDKRRRQLEEEAAGRGVTMPKPAFKTVEQTVGRAAVDAGNIKAGTGDINQTITADEFTTAAPRTELYKRFISCTGSKK